MAVGKTTSQRSPQQDAAAPDHEVAVHRDLTARPVSEIMGRPIAVAADLRLGDALAMMVRNGLRHLIVVDEADRCLGVVGDRAITSAWATDPTALACTRVDHLLDRRRAVVDSTATVGDVAMKMHGDGVDAVGVVDGSGRCVGVVTGGDLVALLAARKVPGSTEARP